MYAQTNRAYDSSVILNLVKDIASSRFVSLTMRKASMPRKRA